jgi:hypothetical protein
MIDRAASPEGCGVIVTVTVVVVVPARHARSVKVFNPPNP